jgi:hypothetical protein
MVDPVAPPTFAHLTPLPTNTDVSIVTIPSLFVTVSDGNTIAAHAFNL